MPQIPEFAATLALQIFRKSTFEARVAIGQRQATFKHPVEPGTQQVALGQLKAEKVLVETKEKIDLLFNP